MSRTVQNMHRAWVLEHVDHRVVLTVDGVDDHSGRITGVTSALVVFTHGNGAVESFPLSRVTDIRRLS